ncbi:hypothetical protein DQ04_06751030 [Trypanosoma grayi]|uniref:hypothetical protein n=1 Tax=Trypanosoma grayi TaxID=71804 RepID=UPI0004F40DAD|nr:hypothetical protein DQ04_06751030 [Trypanosoma grayi]KEG08637.1 hypothetical protein DQ04_06751030 [Trypanosoma grayi]
MDDLAHILRGMAPGQIEHAVQLLQRYSAASQQQPLSVLRSSGGDADESSNYNNNGPTSGSGEADGVKDSILNSATAGGHDAVSSAISLALRHAAMAANGVSSDENSANNVEGDDGEDDGGDDDDLPLAVIAQKKLMSTGRKVPRSAARKKPREAAATAEGNALPEHQQQQQQQQQQEQQQEAPSADGNRTPVRKGKASPKAASASPAVAVRGLASFGFVSATKKPVLAAGEKNKLFTPFVQDKRLVPAALRFWCSGEAQQEQQQQQQQEVREDEDEVLAVRHTIAVDENSSSLMHSPVMLCGEAEEERDVQLREGPPLRYLSFTDMIDATSANKKSRGSGGHNNNAVEAPPLLQCPCGFHVSLPAPRVGFCNEMVFCGFYAIGYDPCQSRPPYFGTYSSQDGMNTEELLRLARIGVGCEIPRLSNLDYEYDSGDDWDVVEGDEDVGASSSDTDDEEDGSGTSPSASDDDFINDNDEDEEDSDAELQRRMFEARQRRVNRLRHKDKLVPAFSGPFVGVAMLEHPLREYDKMERISSTLDGAAFTALLEQEMRAAGASLVNNNNSSGGCVDVGPTGAQQHDYDDEQQQQQQRLLAAALRNRREMFPEELDAVHAIIAANRKISPKAIVEALQQQQVCAGVARAEILRTIRRYYERKHNTLVRREEPWSVTDERLFRKQLRPREGDGGGGGGDSINNNNNNSAGPNIGNGEGERNRDNDEEDAEEDDEDITLVALAQKRPRAASSGGINDGSS